MKKIIMKIFHIVLSLIMVCSLVTPPKSQHTKAATVLDVGETLMVYASPGSPSYSSATAISRTYVWSSSNGDVVSLDRYGQSCTIRALRSGSTVVTCRVSLSYQTYDSRLETYLPRYEEQFVGSWSIEVSTPDPSGISLDSSSMTFNGSYSGRTLSYSLYPNGATTTLYWSTSNSNVATVNNGVVYPKGIGTAVITVRTHNGYSDSCSITVERTLSLAEDTVILQKGKAKELNAEVHTIGENDPKITWKSSNTKVAKVSSSGKVSAIGAGSAVITASLKDGHKVSCTIKVPKVVPSKITLNKTSKTVEKGSKFRLECTKIPSNASAYLTWSSSDSSVASVDQSGKVTAHKAGSVNITVSSFNGKKAVCKVKVKVTAQEAVFKQKPDYLYKGDSVQLKTSITPSDYTSKITYKSSNTSVVTISSKGVLKAKSVGSTTISIYADGKKMDSFTVKVYNVPTKITLNKTELTFENKEAHVSQNYQLSAKVAPSNTKTDLTWSSSDSSVASVDQNGKVTTKSIGTAVISVKTSNGLKTECHVNVMLQATGLSMSPDIKYVYLDETLQFEPIFTPSNARGIVTYTSSKSKVASINKKGLLKAKEIGETRVIAYLDGRAKDYCDINVYYRPTSIQFQKETVYLALDTSDTLSYALSPMPTDADVVFTSSDESIVKVDQTGVVKAQGTAGTATITAKIDDGIIDTCEVKVYDIQVSSDADKKIIPLEGSMPITISTQPSSSLTPVYTSSNPDIVSVDEDGVMHAHQAGMTYVSVTFDEIRNFKHTIPVFAEELGGVIVDLSKGYHIDVGNTYVKQVKQLNLVNGEVVYNKYSFTSGQTVIFTGDWVVDSKKQIWPYANSSVNDTLIDIWYSNKIDPLKMKFYEVKFYDHSNQRRFMCIDDRDSAGIEIISDSYENSNKQTTIYGDGNYVIQLPTDVDAPVTFTINNEMLVRNIESIDDFVLIGCEGDVSDLTFNGKGTLNLKSNANPTKKPLIGSYTSKTSNYYVSNILIEKDVTLNLDGGYNAIGSRNSKTFKFPTNIVCEGTFVYQGRNNLLGWYFEDDEPKYKYISEQ